MRIVHGVALRNAYAMRLVTGITRRFFALNVLAVLGKTIVVQNTVAAVTAIAKRVGELTFQRVIQNGVVASQQWRVFGSVRALRPRSADARSRTRIMAAGAADDSLFVQRENKARYIIVSPGLGDRVERRII